MTDPISIAVVGAHLTGQPLNHELTDRGAVHVATSTTAPIYRLYALETDPPKPGLIRVGSDDPSAGAIEVEIWRLGAAEFGDFVDHVRAPLTIGRVVLADGNDLAGFLCEPVAARQAKDITSLGGWRSYLALAGAAPA